MKNLLTVLGILFFSISLSMAQGHQWTGAIDTDWHKAGNWAPAIIPNSTHHVIIPSAPANQPKITGAGGICNSLALNAGASLTIQATSTSIATLTTSGTATIAGQLNLNGYFVIGTNNPAKLIAGNVIWSGSSVFSSTGFPGIDVSGNWEFATGSNINMGGCSVNFIGNNDSQIISNSATSIFGFLYVNKTGGAKANINHASTSNLRIFMLNIQTGQLTGAADITTIVSGHFNNSGGFKFYQGTVSLQSTLTTQQLQVNPGDFFNNLTINGSATVSLNNDLEILGNFTLLSGTFNPNNHTMKVWGNWSNHAGPDNFIEGTGKVIFYYVVNKSGERDLYDHEITHSEHFNILEVYNQFGGYIIINNPAATVSCNQYSYVSGGVKVFAGTFTALDLAQDGIYGYFELANNGVINLTNDDYVHLSGTLVIHGGVFNIYGASTVAAWPYNGNASITMSAGVLNHHTVGFIIQNHATYTFSANISGGTIRTENGFWCGRSDFLPAAGTFEFFGSSNTQLAVADGSELHHLTVNKTSGTVTLNTNVTINGNLNLDSGTLMAGNRVIRIGGNFNKNTGVFNKGTSRVIFQGNDHQFINSNFSFYTLEIDAATIVAINTNMGITTCDFYDWTSGTFEVKGGSTFIANHLSDPGIYGNWVLHENGTIHLNSNNLVDLNAGLVIWGGEFNIWGGNQDSRWAHAADAHIFMQGGELSFHDQGIIITDTDFDFTHNITGGTIRTTGDFISEKSSFNPIGGELEFYGEGYVHLKTSNGSALHNLRINKPDSGPNLSSVTCTESARINNSIFIEQGLFDVTYGTIECNQIEVSTAGHFNVISGTVKFENDGGLVVRPGGDLIIDAYSEKPVFTGVEPDDYYYFTIEPGAYIVAENAIFENMNEDGVNIQAGAIVNPYHAFRDCWFRNGKPGPESVLLTIDYLEDLFIRDAVFFENIWGGGYNVRKSSASGNIVFSGVSGLFAGETFEDDPNGRIHWIGNLAFEEIIDGFVVGSNMSHCFDAFNFLSVSGLVVHEGGDASLIAGQRIRILPGSHFHSGSTVHAYITTDYSFCENPVSMLASIIEEPLAEKVQDHYLPEESIENSFSIRAFPNPTNGSITLELQGFNGSKVMIELFNMHGERILFREAPLTSTYEFDLSAFSPGIYFARVLMDEKFEVIKIMKQ
jgi:hypothetical protein